MMRRAALVCAVLLLTAATDAQEPELPAELQLGLLAKVLSFDRSASFGSDIVIALLYQAELPASVRARDAWLEAARRSPPATVGGLRVTVMAVPYTDEFITRLRGAGADVVVLAPLRSVDVRRTAERMRNAGFRTATGTPEYGNGVVAISLLLRDGRPRIVINERFAAAEGAHFSSQLLRVSEVLR